MSIHTIPCISLHLLKNYSLFKKKEFCTTNAFPFQNNYGNEKANQTRTFLKMLLSLIRNEE